MGTIWIMLLGYKVTLKEMNFKPSDEAEEFAFFSSTEMENIPLHQNIQKLPELLKLNVLP